MPDVTELNAKNSANFMKAVADTIAKLLASLADYLEKEAMFAPQKTLAQWIRQGGGVTAYHVQGKCMNELKYELDKRGLAYLEVKNEVLLVKEPDIQEIVESNRKILIARCNYFQEVDAKEMEDAIARIDKMKDKEIFTMKGLNKYEVEVLKNKCNNISSGFMVGISKVNTPEANSSENNALFDVSIPCGKLMVSDAEKEDFCKSYLEMVFSLYGPNNGIKMKQIDADEKIDLQVETLKGTEQVKYVVGADDKNPKKFIELNEHGFEYYETDIIDGGRNDRQVFRCDISDPNYDAELQRCMDRIFNKAIVPANELDDHLLSEEFNVNSDRPRRTKEQYEYHLAEAELTNKINQMIKQKFEREGTIFQNTQEKFDTYIKEAEQIITTIQKGGTLRDYLPEEAAALQNICEKHDYKLSKYHGINMAIGKFQTNCHQAEKITEKDLKEVRKNYGFTNR